MPDSTDSALTTFYDFTVNDLDGNPVSLEQFRGKKIVVLNTASQCGYTPQYADWEAFYEANQDKVVVLGFPCNDFGGQEPGSSHDISTFCTQNYGITFPMFEKLDVKGPNKAPLYKWLTSPFQNGWNSQEPTWNFCKYVLDENGTLIKFFDSPVKPNNPAFLQAMGL
ncbi:MAG: glutathione peroxidase [Saprospiraceae bacterium]